MPQTPAQSPAEAVAAAQQEADQAEQQIATLEERVRDGDDTVTPEQVTNSRELGRFARLRVDAAHRKAARAAEAARLDQCKSLAAEIDAYTEGSGQHFADLLRTAEDAVRAFVAAVDERNDRITTWRQAMVSLDVPVHNSPLAPGKEHARLGRDERGPVIAGSRRLEPTTPAHWLAAMLTDVVSDRGNSLQTLTIPAHTALSGEAVYQRLATLDAPQEAPDLAGKHFYRGQGGQVLMYDKPFSPADIKRLHLTEISAKEAYGK